MLKELTTDKQVLDYYKDPIFLQKEFKGSLIKWCETCKKCFMKSPYRSKRDWVQQRFCSASCSMTLLAKGKKPDRIYRGQVKVLKLKFDEILAMTRETKNWAFLKKVAMIRDKFKCQVCGEDDVEVLECDHIKRKADFPELEFKLGNIITLCANCHRRKTNEELRKEGKNPRGSLLEFANRYKEYNKILEEGH